MVIVIQCKDQIGLVAAITGVLSRADINIVSMREHVDPVDNRFFVRIVAEANININLLKHQFQLVLPKDADIKINPLPEKKDCCICYKRISLP